jgi:hypothetical protein
MKKKFFFQDFNASLFSLVSHFGKFQDFVVWGVAQVVEKPEFKLQYHHLSGTNQEVVNMRGM